MDPMRENEYSFQGPDMSKKDATINSLLSLFMSSREKAHFPTNSEGFDEDVNLYIAHLLYAVSMPNYTSITEQYISLRDTEVRVLADMAEDKYLKYFIYKVNADNILMHLGIFQDLAHGETPAAPKSVASYMTIVADFYLEAANLNKKIYKRRTAIADVLLRLSKHAEQYTAALACMRKEYFLFLNRYEDVEFCAFLDHMRMYEKRLELERKQNLFLDLYSQWLSNKNGSLKEQINALCNELKELDPSFTFHLE